MHVAESSAHATSSTVTGPGHTCPGLQAVTSERVGEQMVMFAKLPEHISACQIYFLAGPRQLEGAKVRVCTRMRTELEARFAQLAYLIPGEERHSPQPLKCPIAVAPHAPGYQEDSAGLPIREHIPSSPDIIPVAIIEGHYHAPGRRQPTGVVAV